ncbi:MAG: hypothetical protein HRT89_01485 [Lentisphaeria bacterium]|nr:hypothetical protein [Lentisphaeria bacterium]NQZ66718.1 hypothetical protein [Lentisphaeria bacterium]
MNRYLHLVSIILILNSCASKPNPGQYSHGRTPHHRKNKNYKVVNKPAIISSELLDHVPGTAIPLSSYNQIRNPESIRAYHAGRYIDPSDSSIMYEETVLYRIEESSRWKPAATYTFTPPYSTESAYDKGTERSKELLSDLYLAKMAETNRIYEHSTESLKILNKAKQVTMDLMKRENKDNDALLKELAAAKIREKQLSDKLNILTNTLKKVISAEKKRQKIEQEYNKAYGE